MLHLSILLRRCVLTLIVCLPLAALGQVGIGTTTPNSRALLELRSTDRGLLLPRLTPAQVTALDIALDGLPAENNRGMMVYDQTNNRVLVYDGANFVVLAGGGGGSFTSGAGIDISGSVISVAPLGVTNAMLAGGITTNKLSQSGAAVGQVLKWNGTNWVPDADNAGGASVTAGTGIDVTGGVVSIQNQGVTNGLIADGAITDVKVTSVAPGKLTQGGATVGQVLKWNGSSWIPDADNTGAGVTGGTGIDVTGGVVSIQAQGVVTALLADGAVTDAKITSVSAAKVTGLGTLATLSTVAGAQILDNSITDADIQNVGASKITGTITNAQIAAGINLNKLAQDGATTGQVLKWNGTAWVPDADNTGGGGLTAGAGLDITGGVISIPSDAITTPMLADNAVDNFKLANGISLGKLAQDAATNGQVLKWDGSKWSPATDDVGPGGTTYTGNAPIDVTGSVISIIPSGITSTFLATGAVDNNALADGAVTDSKIVDVAASKITGTVTDAQLAAGIDVAKLAQGGGVDGQVLKLVGGIWTPSTDQVGAGGGLAAVLAGTGISVTGSGDVVNIANGGVNTAQLADGAVTDIKVTDVAPGKLTQSGATSGQVLKWNGTAWAPAADDNTGTTYTASNGIQLVGSDFRANFGTTAGTVAQGNDARFTDARTPIGTAAGDLTGTYPNPSVAAIQGRAVLNVAPTDGQVLKWNNTNNRWEPAADDNTGTTYTGSGPVSVAGTVISLATGSITGLYLAPNAVDNSALANDAVSTAKLQDGAVTNAKLAAGIDVAKLAQGSGVDGQVLKLVGGVWTPSTDQVGAGGGLAAVLAGTGITVTGSGDVVNIANGGVNTAQLADGAVTDIKVTDVAPGKLTQSGATSGQVLKWNGTAWAPAADDNTGTTYTASNGIQLVGSDFRANFGTTAGTVAQGNDARFTDARTPIGTAAGDLTGTYPNPSVAAIQGRAVQNVAPTDGQVLKWNNTNNRWEPAADDNTGTAYTASNGIQLVGSDFRANFGTTAGTVAQGNDARFTDARTPIGTAAGDLTGTYPNPSVAAIQGRAVLNVAPTDGQVLKWNNTNNRWEPAADDNTGTTYTGSGPVSVAGTVISLATGSITGLYLAPNAVDNSALANDAVSTAKLQDGAVTDQKITDVAPGKLLSDGAATGQILKWDGSKWSPATDDVGPGGTIYTGNAPIDVTGSVISIIPSGITSTFLATGAVDNNALADGAVTDNKIVDVAAGKITGTITDAQLAAGIDVAKLAQGGGVDGQVLKLVGGIWTPSTDQVGAGGGLAAVLAGTGITVTGSGDVVNIATGGVNTAQLADGAVTDMKVANVAPGKLTQSGATSGQVLKWNGSAWSPASEDGLVLPYTFSGAEPSTLFNLTNTDLGSAGRFAINNTGSAANALFVTSNGTGSALRVTQTSAASAITVEANTTAGAALTVNGTTALTSTGAGNTLAININGGGSALTATQNNNSTGTPVAVFTHANPQAPDAQFTGFVQLDPNAAPAITTSRLYNTGGNLFWNGVQLNGAAGANTTLSNLGATAINADLNFAWGSNRQITIQQAAAGAGDNLTISSGAPAAASNGSGGGVSILAAGGDGSGSGGNMDIQAGQAVASGIGGSTTIRGGASVNNQAGSVSLLGGDAVSTGAGGGATVRGGNGNTGGVAQLRAGNGQNGGGTAQIFGGNSTVSGIGGRVDITGGNGAGASQGGNVNIVGGTGGSAAGNVVMAYTAGAPRGLVGVGTDAPTSQLDVAASNATRASLRLRNGIAPTTPNQGDIYADGNTVFYRTGSTWLDLGASAAGANTSLSNLGTTDINTNLVFNNSADRIVGFLNVSTVAGRSLQVASESTNSASAIPGGNLDLNAGSGNGGAGGIAAMRGGNSSLFAGGSANVFGGDGAAQGGNAQIRGGSSSGGPGGNVIVLGGTGSSTPGNVYLASQFGTGPLGRVGIGLNGTTDTPTALFDVSPSDATRASLRLRTGVAPTTPNQGDIYADGNTLFYRSGAAWVDLGQAGFSLPFSGSNSAAATALDITQTSVAPVATFNLSNPGTNSPVINAITSGTGAGLATNSFLELDNLAGIPAPSTQKLYAFGGNLYWQGTNLSGSIANAVVNNGNAFGGTMSIGTNDNQQFVIETNNIPRATFTSAGRLDLGTPPAIAIPANVAMTATGNGTTSALISVSATEAAGLFMGRFGSNVSTPAPNGQQLGRVGFGGFDGTDLSEGAAIVARADETFSAAGNGASLEFQTTPVGSTTSQTQMRLTDDGRLEIGAQPPAPLASSIKQSIVGTDAITMVISESESDGPYSFLGRVRAGGTPLTAGTSLGTYGFGGVVGTNYNATAELRAVTEQAWPGDRSTTMEFRTSNGSDANTKMVLTGAGNLGIGTASPDPSYRLTVATSQSGSNSGIVVANTTGGINTSTSLDLFQVGSTSTDVGMFVRAVDGGSFNYAAVGTSTDVPLQLFTNGVNRMTITNNTGNVGIGNTPPTLFPSERLVLDGAIAIGNTTNPTPADGTLRYNGTGFEGRVGGAWQALGGSGAGVLTQVVDSQLVANDWMFNLSQSPTRTGFAQGARIASRSADAAARGLFVQASSALTTGPTVVGLEVNARGGDSLSRTAAKFTGGKVQLERSLEFTGNTTYVITAATNQAGGLNHPNGRSLNITAGAGDDAAANFNGGGVFLNGSLAKGTGIGGNVQLNGGGAENGIAGSVRLLAGSRIGNGVRGASIFANGASIASNLGGSASVQGGQVDSTATTGNAGTVNITGGSNDIITGTGNAGSVNIVGGGISRAGNAGNPGQVFIRGGSTSGTGLGGSVTIQSGTSTGNSAGNVSIFAANTSATGRLGGSLTMNAGSASDTTGGTASLSGGSSNSGRGGSANISGGSSTSGTAAGNVQINGGSNNGSGQGGSILLNSGFSSSGQPGNIQLIAANGNTNFNGGSVNVSGGFGFGGPGGGIQLSAGGTNTGAASAGSVSISAGTNSGGTGGQTSLFGGTGGINGGFTTVSGGYSDGGTGGSVSIQGGFTNTGRGGSVSITGPSGPTGGGAVTISTGSSSGGSSAGSFDLTAGSNTGTGNAGSISLTAGSVAASVLTGGAVSLTAGNGTGFGGPINLFAGNGTTAGTGGNITIRAGQGQSGGLGGDVRVVGGNGTVNGDVILAHDGATPIGNVGVGVNAPVERLEVAGAVTLGNTTNASANGTIRFTGTAFEGRVGGAWQSLGGSAGANTTLSNLAGPTAINTDLNFAIGAARTLGIQATTTNTGTALTISAGTGSTSINSDGGGLNLRSAQGFLNGSAGTLDIRGGQAPGTGVGGFVYLAAGQSTSGQGGSMFIAPGNGVTQGNLFLGHDNINRIGNIVVGNNSLILGNYFDIRPTFPGSATDRTFLNVAPNLFSANQTGTTTMLRVVPTISVVQATGVNRGLDVNISALTGGTNYAATFLGGNVGVGTNTPAEALEVTGNIRLSAGADRTISVSSVASAGLNMTLTAGTSTGTSGGSLNLSGGNGAVTSVGGAVNINGGSSGGFSNGGSVFIKGGTSASGTGGSVFLRGGTDASGANGNVFLGDRDGSATTRTSIIAGADFLVAGRFFDVRPAYDGSATNRTILNVAPAIASAQTGTVTGLNVDVSGVVGTGADYAAIFQGGNVGIGTATPSARFEVAGGTGFFRGLNTIATPPTATATATADFASGRGSSGNLTPTSTTGDIVLQYGDGGFRHFIQSRHISAANSTGNAIDFYLNNSTTATASVAPNNLVPNGNVHGMSVTSVGVGIGTSDPTYNLEVQRQSATLIDLSLGGRVFSNDPSSSTDLYLYRSRGTATTPVAVAANDEVGNIIFQGYSTGGNALGAIISTFAEAAWSSTTVAPTRMTFRTTGTSGGLQERMRITADGNVGIGTPAAPVARFQVEGGAILAAGTTGATPISGAGTRMMWVPAKSAFRAGRVSGSQFDDASIGVVSFAMGDDANASGDAAFAFGQSVGATGTNSVAMGSDAYTNNFNGAFAFGDNSNVTNLQANLANQFNARFSGGYRLFSNAAVSIGVQVAAGGNAWTTISDSARKTGFMRMDPEYALAGIRDLRLGSWHYKEQPASMRHYGPMAQEIFKHFGTHGGGVIGNDTTLATADVDGILFLAAQGLEHRTRVQAESLSEVAAELDRLRQENESLRKLLQQLSQSIQVLEAKLTTPTETQPTYRVVKGEKE